MKNKARKLYIDLLIRCIANTIYEDASFNDGAYKRSVRQVGRDWPSKAHSMAGVERLENLARLTRTVIRKGVPGDFIETGVWRGGCCILMKGILSSYGDTKRTVFVADSFEGLPPPDPKHYPADEGLDLNKHPELAIPLEEVRGNFEKYGLLDGRVQFIKGFFKDTLATAPIEKLALMRLDGDLYESTIVALEALYPKLSYGGFVIIDDYGCIPACAKAVNDFREAHDIQDEMHTIDWTGIYWRKSVSTRKMFRSLFGRNVKQQRALVSAETP